jgi:hypothetical protein
MYISKETINNGGVLRGRGSPYRFCGIEIFSGKVRPNSLINFTIKKESLSSPKSYKTPSFLILLSS